MDFSTLNHNAPKLHTSKMLVRFQDCDPFGHLNNGRYIDYFLNARDNQVTYDYKLSLPDFVQALQEGWVVQKHEICFLRPAQYGEEIIVQTATAYFDDSYLLIEGRMYDQNQDHLKAHVWIHLAYISLKTGRKTSHNEETKKFFEAIYLNEFNPKEISFDQRTQDLKRK